jgi:hypothetical protein
MDRSSRPLDRPCSECGGVMEFVNVAAAHRDLATYCCDQCGGVATCPVERDSQNQGSQGHQGL